jgi:hypothetical protein
MKPHKNDRTKKIVNRWSAEDKRAFSEQRLRAATMPNKKRVAGRKACRGRVHQDWA